MFASEPDSLPDVFLPLLRLLEYFHQIFPQHGNGKKLDPAEEQDQHDDQRYALRDLRVHQPGDYLRDPRKERDAREHKPGIATTAATSKPPPA